MSEWKWIDTLTRQFELCAASDGKDVVLAANTTTPNDLIDTALIALQRTGAQGSLLVLPSPGPSTTPSLSASAQAALDAAELVIDCTTHGLEDATDSDILILGARPASGIERHVPHPGMKERVQNAQTLLRERTELTITSLGGTDLSVEGDDAEVAGSWGCPHPQRRADRWPGGFVELALLEDHTSSGSLVLMPGDLNVTLGETVHSPVTIEIEAGRICEIQGESGDADLLRAYLESFEDDDVYQLTAVTIGLNHAVAVTAPFARRAESDDRSVLSAGQLSVTFGPPGAEVLTLGLRTSTLALGKVTPVRDGVLTGEVAPDVYELAATQPQ